MNKLLSNIKQLSVGGFIFLSLAYCIHEDTIHSPSLKLPATKNGKFYQAYVEASTGTYDRLIYNLNTKTLDSIILDAKPVLPLPVNAGFIPFNKDNQQIKVQTWILGQPLEIGDTLKVLPLGLVKYEVDSKVNIDVFAVPHDEQYATVSITKFRDLIINHDPVKFNFEYWLRHGGNGNLTQLSWEDEVKAIEYLDTQFK